MASGRHPLRNPALREASRWVLGPEEVAQLDFLASDTFVGGIVERAVAFIQRHRDEDFLLVVAPDEPHHPFIAPEPFVGAFDDFRIPVPNATDSLEEKPLLQQEWAKFSERNLLRLLETVDGEALLKHPPYFACNSFLDSQMGRLLEAVDQDAREALIIYTADHGDMFGAHGLAGKGPAMYQEITRIPFLVRWPEHAPAAAQSTAPVSHIDLMPTLLEYFDLPVPSLLEGTSLLSGFFDPSAPAGRPVFIEFNRFEVDHDGFGAFAPIRCVFDGRWKLAINLLDTDELYDLDQDPGELTNLIGQPGLEETRVRLHDLLLSWMDDTRDPFRGPPWRRRSWRTLECSSWGGPTRPRPADPCYFPTTLLYDTGEAVTQRVYAKD